MARLQMLCLLVVLWLPMPIKGQKADFEVRLVDGKTPHDGRVEIRKNKNYWLTVCSRLHWDLIQANVVCRMLNYTKAVSVGTTDITNLYPFHIYRSGIFCKGYETSIEQCWHYYNNNASLCDLDIYKDAATVVCGNLTTEEKAIKVRLVGSSRSHVGQVEIQYNGTWGAVCNFKWDIKDAHVICRMLGYKAAEGAFNVVGQSTTKILMSGVECSGKEKSIAECYHNGWWNGECYWRYGIHIRAGVVCQEDGDRPPVQVRLAGGTSPNSGRVEVRYHGMWVGVCDKNVPKVVCHMLGYRGVRIVEHSNYDAKSKFWLYRYGCSGEEMSFSNCSGQWEWYKSKFCIYKYMVTCTTVSQPRIAASEALPCTAELTINSTTNTDIENKLIQFYDIQLINKHNKASFSLLVAGSVSNFTIGDGKYYNGSYNAPLEPGSTYNITVRAVTRTYDEGYTYGEANLIVFTTSLCTKGLSSAALQIKTSLMLSIVCSFLSLFR